MAPFVVSLIGTKTDMVDLRAVILRQLMEWGYSGRAFDEENYPYSPGEDPAEWSVAIARESDVVVLVIDKRYGNRLPNGLSISENEWRVAAHGDAIVIPCVRQRAMDDFRAREKQTETSRWRPSYVDETAVLDFIGSVLGSEYVIEFDTAPDLLKKLDGKFGALTPYVLRRLSRAGRDYARRRKTVTVVDARLSLGDVFDRGLFVSPPHEVVSGQLPDGSLEERAFTSFERRHKLVLSGGPGAGKSSALGSVFFGLVERQDQHPLTVPLYVDCRRLSADGLGSVEALVRHLFGTYMGREMWPHFRTDDPNVRADLLFDALDEIQGDSASVRDAVVNSPVWNWGSHMVTFRNDFYSRLFSIGSVASRYNYVVELQPWSVDFIQSYVEKKFSDDPAKAAKLSSLITRPGPLQSIASHPIGLVMLCSLDDLEEIDDPARLYQRFLQRWTTREAERAEEDFIDSASALSIWRRVAWAILVGEVRRGDPTDRLPSLFGDFNSRREAANSQTVKSLLEVQMDGDTEVMTGFIHHSIYEYLLAEDVALRLKGSLDETVKALEQDTWYEVNEFVQRLIARWNEAECVNALETLIECYRARRNDPAPKSLLVRNKACYYIGGLGRQGGAARTIAFQFLGAAWRDEESLFVRQSIGFARSIGGEPGAAREFIEEMTRNDTLDRSNRGYHLVYYQDEKDVAPPYEDRGDLPWMQTRRVLGERLADGSEPRRCSRPVDLYTLLRFLESRKEFPSPEEISTIRRIRSELTSYLEEMRELIRRLCDAIDGMAEPPT